MPKATQRRTPSGRLAAAVLCAALGVASCGEAVAPARETFAVAIASSGAGSGTITSTPAGIACQISAGSLPLTGCAAAFPAGTSVMLSALPASAGQEFVGWGAPCAGTTACTFVVSANATLSAGFRARVQTFSLALQTPNADDGAILLNITGPSVLAVRPVPGLEVREVRDTVAGVVRSRVLVRGAIASGLIGEVDVSAGATPVQFTLAVQEAAARASGHYARRMNLGSYLLSLR